jgi:dTDP-4-dehydrorhamnose reductase
MSRVVVLGASGFVGSAVVRALESEGHEVTRLSAPRLARAERLPSPDEVRHLPEVARLVADLAGADAVVNAAGDPDASSTDQARLRAANAVMPGVLAAAVHRVGSARLVHISSAVVQGRQPVLDDGVADADFSAYARSKTEGEHLVAALAPGQSVIYRPPSVHAPDRRVTRLVARIAASPLRTVASPGDAPSPQALLQNVASAVAFLATTSAEVPPIAAHPSEGLTVSSTMELLGGRQPHRLPRSLARAVTSGLELAGRGSPRIAAHARRVEMLWFGQGQAPSWLTQHGWVPVEGPEAWAALGRRVRSELDIDKHTKETTP